MFYLNETSIMANIRYFPRRGTTSEVGGIISTTSRKNTYKLVRMDIESVTCNKDNTSGSESKYFSDAKATLHQSLPVCPLPKFLLPHKIKHSKSSPSLSQSPPTSPTSVHLFDHYQIPSCSINSTFFLITILTTTVTTNPTTIILTTIIITIFIL